MLDRAAILFAFEQVGGADRALEMARDYALERMAFGRPIGSFQAIKHMLADMYVRGDAGALERLLRRLGAVDRRRRTAGRRGHRARVGDRGVPALRQEQHPGAWRHGFHLGVRLPPLLPALEPAGAGARHRCRSGKTC